MASHGSHAPPTKTEVVHTTQKHPWFTTKGWVTAGELHLGDQVLSLNGTTATVVGLKVIPGEHDMYDLTVSNVHTFAVGDGQWIVHNVGPACAVTGGYRQVANVIKDNVANGDGTLANNQSHHIFQDAMMRNLPGYSRDAAPSIALLGPSSAIGTPHYLATQVQGQAAVAFRNAGRTSLTFSEAENVARDALSSAGYSGPELDRIIANARDYFLTNFSPSDLNQLRIPGTR